MKTIFFALTFLMLFLGMPIPRDGGTELAIAALPPYAVTQAAAQETAACPNGSIEQTEGYNGEYIIVDEPALSVLDQTIQDAGGPPKPEKITRVVLLIPAEGSPIIPMATFDENDCFVSGVQLPTAIFTLFVEQLKSQKEAKE